MSATQGLINEKRCINLSDSSLQGILPCFNEDDWEKVKACLLQRAGADLVVFSKNFQEITQDKETIWKDISNEITEAVINRINSTRELKLYFDVYSPGYTIFREHLRDLAKNVIIYHREVASQDVFTFSP